MIAVFCLGTILFLVGSRGLNPTLASNHCPYINMGSRRVATPHSQATTNARPGASQHRLLGFLASPHIRDMSLYRKVASPSIIRP